MVCIANSDIQEKTIKNRNTDDGCKGEVAIFLYRLYRDCMHITASYFTDLSEVIITSYIYNK